MASQGREDELLHLQSTLLRSAEAVATTEQAPTSSWVASDIAVCGSRASRRAGPALATVGRQRGACCMRDSSENIINIVNIIAEDSFSRAPLV